MTCCHRPASPRRDLHLQRDVAAIDWRLFGRMARRHRVQGLVRSALKRAGVSAPPDIAKSLDQAADAIAKQNLQIALESNRLKRTLEKAAIPVLFLKGISLGALAYDTILLKSGWDIDILVPRDSILAAAALLRENGYVPVMPPVRGDLQPIVYWHLHSKESVWHHPERGTDVELHSALTDFPFLIASLGYRSPRQHVPVTGDITLPTFATDELFAYLCVHGASSAWFRLKWIADVAALLATREASEISRLYNRSQALGAGRAADVALLLCNRLFDTAVDPELIARLGRNASNRLLIAAVEYSLSGRSVATEILKVKLGTLGIHLSQFGLQPSLRYKLGVLRQEFAPLRPSMRRLRKGSTRG